MIPLLTSPLPTRDLALLNTAARIVPEDDRNDWLRCWQAELWHRHHPRVGGGQPATDLYAGLLRDALWLREECLRRALSGTAFLCLISLISLALLVTLPLLVCLGEIDTTCRFLLRDTPRFMVEAALTSIVGFLFASQTTMHLGRHSHSPRMRAYLFGASKLALLQVVAYLSSLDITMPFHVRYLFASEIMQPQIFALITLVALRWGFEDQGTRCRHCLRSLSAPLRMADLHGTFLTAMGLSSAAPRGTDF